MTDPVTPPPPEVAQASSLPQLDDPGLRGRFESLILRELLGPAGGPDEVVDEDKVRDRYLVGTLAPKYSRVDPGQNDHLGIEDGSGGEDGPTAGLEAEAQTVMPSSVGLSFAVEAEAAGLLVRASWGRYRLVPRPSELEGTGKRGTVWRREAVTGTVRIVPLAEGPVDDLVPSPDQPEVTVRGVVRPNHERAGGGWVVTLFLVNGQQELRGRAGDTNWIFQPELAVEGLDGRPVFTRRSLDGLFQAGDPLTVDETLGLRMRDRDCVEFAVGHGAAAEWELFPGDPTRATQVRTTVAPTWEVRQQRPRTPTDDPALAGLLLDMSALADRAEGDPASLAAALAPLPEAYDGWIRRQRERISDPAQRLGDYPTEAEDALGRCAEACRRIRAGIALLAGDPDARAAFGFANRAMADQRVRSLYAEAVRRLPPGAPAPDPAAFDQVGNRTWFPFQLAFILINLPGLTRLDHEDRSNATRAPADLLFFPTGGGKTEAYLGLAAYIMGLRRLKGIVGDRDGRHGVAVLMRFTLRLLTIQQFQRAATLVAACEVIRRARAAAGDDRWGTEPFRIGLWVGQRTTPNSVEAAAEAVLEARGGHRQRGGSPLQLRHCPWCGSPLHEHRSLFVETGTTSRERVITYCDGGGDCPFSRRLAPGEGLPVMTVDEEIFRRLPSLLIATIDKFAQMPWDGRVQMLFGQVDGLCTRHGFRSPDIADADRHQARGSLPAAQTVPALALRPPDLIIQDELHLISGPLGSLAGLYETAVDRLCSWTLAGRTVRPKVIASTATIRQSSLQVHNLFRRSVRVFPPPGLDAGDDFFSLRREPDEYPGRRYVGICAPGKRVKAAMIRVYTAALAAAQRLYEDYGDRADPWMTLLGYFNSLRELGGMRRLVEDDVRQRLRGMDVRGLGRRNTPFLKELTSRIDARDIPDLLDDLEIPFSRARDAERRAARAAGAPVPKRPLDVLLATNMISVGVDVRRLGLMVVGGQPKTTAEYIQATSRVGRSRPGLVLVVYNWARPRDLSHYERFRHYHSTFYQHVEALSVTPFAPRALDRGLAGVLIAMVRLAGRRFNGNGAAGGIDRHDPAVTAACEAIVERCRAVQSPPLYAEEVRRRLTDLLDEWSRRAVRREDGIALVYDRRKDRSGAAVSLLQRPGQFGRDDFTCLNSLRDVEPSVGLVFNRIDLGEPDAPAWQPNPRRAEP